MPVQRCSVKGVEGWKWGKSGKCYTEVGGKAKATKQGQAVRATGWTENLSASMGGALFAAENVRRTSIVRPMKSDPTRTKTLRRRFEQDIGMRFIALKRAIIALVVEEDAFGLSLNRPFNQEQDDGTDNNRHNAGPSDNLPSSSSDQATTLNKQEQNDESSSFLGGDIGSLHSNPTNTREQNSGNSDFRVEMGSCTGGRDGASNSYNNNPSVVGLNQEEQENDSLFRGSDSGLSPGGLSGNDIHNRFSSNRSGRILNQRFAFKSTTEQVTLFEEWIKGQLDDGLINLNDPYWEKYIRQGYEKGAGRAFNDTYRARRALSGSAEQQAFFDGTREQFLETAFGQQESIEKVQLLASRTLTDLKGVSGSVATRMGRILTDGLIQGIGPRAIAKLMIDDKSLGIDKRRAQTIARTECLTAETLVDRAVVRAVFRRWYEGDMVDISTTTGRKLTTTPNHPMLTQRGWVAASLLQNSDYLVGDNRKQNFGSSGNENIKTGPTSIGEIFDSLNAVGVAERITTTQPDFHGDGIDGQVDILRPNRHLHIGNFAPISKPLAENIFSPSDLTRFTFCPECSTLLPIDQIICLLCGSQVNSIFDEAVLDAPPVYSESQGQGSDRLTTKVSFSNLPDRYVESVLVSNLAFLPREQLSSRDRSRDISFTQHFTDLLLVRPDLSSNLPLSKPGEVQFDNVVSVRICPFSGHVYNLQTPFGYFTIDSLYTGNTIRAHAEGQLDALEQMGVEEVGVMVEWSTAGDDRVCFKAGVMILTDSGNVPIQDIKVHDLVQTRTGLQRVLSTHSSYSLGPFVQITTIIGETIKSTYDHPFWAGGAWVEAQNLIVGDKLLTPTREVAITEVSRRIIDEGVVYDIEVENHPEFFANGLLVHNCPLCQPLESVVLKIEEARGAIPRHPSCRCSFVPANVGEPKGTTRRVNFGEGTQEIGQKKSKSEIEKAIKTSVSRERKAGTLKEKLKRSPWRGADKASTIARFRPKSILDTGVVRVPGVPRKIVRKPVRVVTPKPVKPSAAELRTVKLQEELAEKKAQSEVLEKQLAETKAKTEAAEKRLKVERKKVAREKAETDRLRKEIQKEKDKVKAIDRRMKAQDKAREAEVKAPKAKKIPPKPKT